MISTLKSIYQSVEPKSHEKEVVDSAKEQIEKEVLSDSFLSKEYLTVTLSQLKYYVKTNIILYVVEISELLNFFKEQFDLDNPAEIIRQ